MKDSTKKKLVFSTFLAKVTGILGNINNLEVTVIEPGETKYVEGMILTRQHYHRFQVVIKVVLPLIEARIINSKTHYLFASQKKVHILSADGMVPCKLVEATINISRDMSC